MLLARKRNKSKKSKGIKEKEKKNPHSVSRDESSDKGKGMIVVMTERIKNEEEKLCYLKGERKEEEGKKMCGGGERGDGSDDRRNKE